MIICDKDLTAPLEFNENLSAELGVEFFVQRDDLLPFPLAGNKVRKLSAELGSLVEVPEIVITNGGIDSNHCRTLALFAAQLGVRAHLVLHGDRSVKSTGGSLRMLKELGATIVVVPPENIGLEIAAATETARRHGLRVHVIPGGCHSRAGAQAYAEVGAQVLATLRPDWLFVASGTGATHGGLAAAAARLGAQTRVVGISVARKRERGLPAVVEAASWAGAPEALIEFDDRFRAEGYGCSNEETRNAVQRAWKHGLPLDETYTGKAFAGLLSYLRSGAVRGRVLFWHTGGLWNYLSGNL